MSHFSTGISTRSFGPFGGEVPAITFPWGRRGRVSRRGMSWSGIPLQPCGGRGTGPRGLTALGMARGLVPMADSWRGLGTESNEISLHVGGREGESERDRPLLDPMHSFSLDLLRHRE